MNPIAKRRPTPFEKLITTRVSQISHVTGDGNYTKLHMQKGSALFGLTVEVVCDRAPWLLRIHKRYAINPVYAKALHVDTGTRTYFVELTNGLLLPIARRRWTETKQQLPAATVPQLTTISADLQQCYNHMRPCMGVNSIN